MLDVWLLYYGFAAAVLTVLGSVIWFVFSSKHQQKLNRRATTVGDASLKSLSSDSTYLSTEKCTKKDFALANASLLENASNQKKQSLAKLITDVLPSRRGSIASPLSNTPSSSTSSGELPTTTRSQEEIKSFGDFPDYATLSGVRLPNVYLEFNIEKALPRPHRPFRWAYHQTMGML